ncbi:MAG: hypothetical protein MNPFHGCM_01755 [Gemmatimonadaceae bacterium]|nr:hypothetical protein [Gemmatimonadaceae bacterium]
MRSARSVVTILLLAATARALPAQVGQAQGAAAALTRGLDLETSGKAREAVAAYREALADIEQLVPAVLGLERAYSQLGRPDSLLPLLDTLLARQPANPTIRTVQLRTLTTIRRDEDARRAFVQWVAVTPRDPAPYREYARLLLDDLRTLAADSVLQAATRALGSSRELAAELAQLRAALGMWQASSHSWREAMILSPYLDQAAVFSLSPAPVAQRDSVLGELLAPPVELLPRKVAAGLLLRWRSAHDGWSALAALPARDSTIAAWLEYGSDAEANEEWLTARDAFAAAVAHGAPQSYSLRAAQAALTGGEPASTLRLLEQAGSALGDTVYASVVLLKVRALAMLARPQEGERLVADGGARLDALARSQALRAVAWGYVRVGDLQRAKATLEKAGGDEEERASAWIALYEGDLKRARGGLRRTEETTGDAVLAMSFLSRTRVDSSATAGNAFLLLSRGDSAKAANTFERVARELPDVAPLALGVAARLFLAAGDTAHSIALWEAIVAGHGNAPEAAESELEWARVLRGRNQDASAVQHLEHLILTWPQSALVPQARRELELARSRPSPATDAS